MIDSADVARLPTSRSELLTMLSEDELKNVPVLVFANKQDVAGALSPAEISDKLGLAGQEKGREWSVRGSCATKGDGLEEGLDWWVPVWACVVSYTVPTSFGRPAVGPKSYCCWHHRLGARHCLPPTLLLSYAVAFASADIFQAGQHNTEVITRSDKLTTTNGRAGIISHVPSLVSPAGPSSHLSRFFPFYPSSLFTSPRPTVRATPLPRAPSPESESVHAPMIHRGILRPRDSPGLDDAPVVNLLLQSRARRVPTDRCFT